MGVTVRTDIGIYIAIGIGIAIFVGIVVHAGRQRATVEPTSPTLVEKFSRVRADEL